jgi:hypothetical protein
MEIATEARMDDMRIEARRRLTTFWISVMLERFRSGVFRRISDAEREARDVSNRTDVDALIRSAPKKASDAFAMAAILEAVGDDASELRARAAWWADMSERFAEYESQL